MYNQNGEEGSEGGLDYAINAYLNARDAAAQY
jgi:hypothetical protein